MAAGNIVLEWCEDILKATKDGRYAVTEREKNESFVKIMGYCEAMKVTLKNSAVKKRRRSRICR